MLVRSAVSILATAAALSPSFACGSWETWMTEEEIATAKAGGYIRWRSLNQYVQPMLPDIAFASPFVVEGAVEPDAVGGAQLELFAEVNRPLEVAYSAVAPQIEHVAPADAQKVAASRDEKPGLARVVIACDGRMTVSPTLL